MGIVNLAHGAFFMTGAYTGTYVAKATNSLLIGILAGGFLATAVGFSLIGASCASFTTAHSFRMPDIAPWTIAKAVIGSIFICLCV
jgi:branched-subunit amino acid ABC-type transport system permease component